MQVERPPHKPDAIAISTASDVAGDPTVKPPDTLEGVLQKASMSEYLSLFKVSKVKTWS